MTMNVRVAVEEDAPQIYQFICDLAEYEKALPEVKCTTESLQESLFGGNSVAFSLIVEEEGASIGFAIYFFNYSTWLAAKGLYLEDLYVDPAYRGKGAGLMLMRTLARIAEREHCARFEWSVLDWNAPSIAFYEAIGAKPKEEWLGYRLAGEALSVFAKSG